ncbi:MAG: transcription initiation factor IIB [Candidatus Aramenus sulfurataquae]|uniref:Transcription initiation factor IIB n=2 Tax=Candidatus Aramenus sulfurataquae TaxID=1326980 RepID=W7KY59_9CREN|nr:MAG: transcription initiation factor IIB [Candidatus Aramenus sulfurataquae]MBW9141471.1 transcription initiation factor IIB [Candidatus Aramenus sp.]MCL7343432.1 transcription initiation factor IIB [Candidatus Aramenus sulfurataquae]
MANEQDSKSNTSICPPDKIIFDADRGEYICTETGEVIEDRIVDQGPEWRAFTPEEKEKRSRVGGPLNNTIHDRGLSTLIDWKDKDAIGRNLDPKRRLEVLRWRKWQVRARIQSSIDRNLAQAMNELERIGNLLGLPKSVKDEAALIYRKAVEKGLVRGRSIESVVAASIYASCRRMKIARTLDEIAQYTKANRKEVARCYRLLLRELDVEVPVSDPKDYVTRIGSLLGLSGATMKLAAEILEKAKNVGLTAGKDPAGLAAAAIYIAALLNDERRTQKEIAQVAGVTEVTVRNRYKELTQELKIPIQNQ